MSFFAFALALLASLSSCRKQPAAEFTASNVNPAVGDNVMFTNSSADAFSYEWDFGDGMTSTDKSPMHSYTAPGSYVVKLTAYSKKEKKSDDATAVVTVSNNSAITYNGNTYTLADGLLQYFGDYYSMNNGNYDVILFSSGISYLNEQFSGTGDLLYFEMLSLQTGLVNSDYDYDPQDTYATFTFTSSSRLYTNYDFAGSTYDDMISFSSGQVAVEVTGNTYKFEIDLLSSTNSPITGTYQGSLNYKDSSKGRKIILPIKAI